MMLTPVFKGSDVPWLSARGACRAGLRAAQGRPNRLAHPTALDAPNVTKVFVSIGRLPRDATQTTAAEWYRLSRPLCVYSLCSWLRYGQPHFGYRNHHARHRINLIDLFPCSSSRRGEVVRNKATYNTVIDCGLLLL